MRIRTLYYLSIAVEQIQRIIKKRKQITYLLPATKLLLRNDCVGHR